MYSAREQGMGALQQNSSWWTSSDRWIPPPQLRWTRPLLMRLRMAKRVSSSPSPWLRVS